jgi:hypothetical protein
VELNNTVCALDPAHGNGVKHKSMVVFDLRGSYAYPYFRRHIARCQGARSAGPRSRRVLRDGPGLPGFRTVVVLHQSGGFFVTLANLNMNFQRVHSAPIDCSTGLICDKSVTLNNFYAS